MFKNQAPTKIRAPQVAPQLATNLSSFQNKNIVCIIKRIDNNSKQVGYLVCENKSHNSQIMVINNNTNCNNDDFGTKDGSKHVSLHGFQILM